MNYRYYPIINLAFIFLFFIGCASETPVGQPPPVKKEKEIWVYEHFDKYETSYTVFSNELPINKGILPANFLAIRNSKRIKWNCLLKWEGEVLWFYTPSKSYFASNNSNNGKTQWTIVTQSVFDSLFYETVPEAYIRFSSNCNEPNAYCLGSEDLKIGGLDSIEKAQKN